MGEADFLRAVLADPKDDALLKVYSDWLEDQGDPVSAAKAEFLRLTVEPRRASRKGGKKARQRRLQELAAALDPDWLAVVSRLQLENCVKKRREGEGRSAGAIQFEFVCDRRWEDLASTDERGIRHCHACELSVHYCDTIMDARKHASEGHCIAVDLGIIRRVGDIQPDRLTEGMLLGRPSPGFVQRELERLRPDPVSAERDRRKQPAPEPVTDE